MINIIYNLERKGFLRKQDRKNLFSLLKDGNISELYGKINSINLISIDNYSLSNRHLLMALTSDIGFQEPQFAEEHYRKSVEVNKFDLSNYMMLARFYQKNCRYDEAIDTLLTISSIAISSSQKINLINN
ncbi:MAG: hypothetical protein LBP39_02390, partial [Rickettsiales bacterium]|nr:hypothetical protein [Rickettsiales bacterium]